VTYDFDEGTDARTAARDDGLTPLHRAAMAADAARFERLLEEGAALEARDRWGRTPLLTLCHYAHPPETASALAARPLRQRPAFADAMQTLGLALLWEAEVDVLAHNGHAPLHVVALRAASEMLEMLLDAGANPGLADLRRYTPLHAAASGGDVACVERLLAAGAVLDRQDHAGFTPLHCACLAGRTAVAHLLLRRGADPSRTIIRGFGTARPGMTAVDLAEAAGFDLGVGYMSTRCG